LRSRALIDVFAYGEYVHGYPPEPHHREMVEFILQCYRDRVNGVVLEPRGSAKTTWGDTIFGSWIISRFKDLRVGLFSNTANQAKDFSRALRHTLEENQRQIELFGNLKSAKKWTDGEWLRAGSRWHGSKDVTLYAQGVTGAVISKRFDLILCDDILDEENSRTPEQRELVRTWFLKTVRPCLVPGGIVIVLGTRWDADDLYGEMIGDPAKGGWGWRSLVRGAIRSDEEGNEVSYWPGYWPMEKLQQERGMMGSALFNCAYMNDVSGLMAGTIFQSRYFQYFESLPSDKRLTWRMGVDLATSERETADYTARVVTAEDEEGNFYVFSFYRDRRESHHAEFVVEGWLAYPQISLVKMETNQAQSAIVRGIMEDYPRIPIEGKKTETDKVSRARSVAARYEAHKVWHHISLKGSDLEQELITFNKGHDDLVDALGFSMDLSGDSFIFGSLRR
jgi:predicted phage terminase large subunit-like protein